MGVGPVLLLGGGCGVSTALCVNLRWGTFSPVRKCREQPPTRACGLSWGSFLPLAALVGPVARSPPLPCPVARGLPHVGMPQHCHYVPQVESADRRPMPRPPPVVLGTCATSTAGLSRGTTACPGGRIRAG